MIPQPVQYSGILKDQYVNQLIQFVYNEIIISIYILETDINPFSLAPASVGLLSIASEHLGPVVESEGSPLSIIQLTNILEQR